MGLGGGQEEAAADASLAGGYDNEEGGDGQGDEVHDALEGDGEVHCGAVEEPAGGAGGGDAGGAGPREDVGGVRAAAEDRLAGDDDADRGQAAGNLRGDRGLRGGDPEDQGDRGEAAEESAAVHRSGHRPPEGSPAVWPPWDGEDPAGPCGRQLHGRGLHPHNRVGAGAAVHRGGGPHGEGDLQAGAQQEGVHPVLRRGGRLRGHALRGRQCGGGAADDARGPQPAGRVRLQGKRQGAHGHQQARHPGPRPPQARQARQEDRVRAPVHQGQGGDPQDTRLQNEC